MESSDLKLAEVEMTEEELAGVYGGFLTEMARECSYEMTAGEDQIFM